MKTLSRRLASVERTAQREAAEWRSRAAAEDEERTRPVMSRIICDPLGRRALRTMSGQRLPGTGKIPDESDIEGAIGTLGERMAFHAQRLGIELRPRPDDGRCGLLPVEDTDFNQALHRFGNAGLGNVAMALRFINASRFRDRGGEWEDEYHAARAALTARFEAFKKDEQRKAERSDRRRAAAMT